MMLKRRPGFTLIEVIIYLAIVSMMLVSISLVMINILGGQHTDYAGQEVNYNLRFVSNLLERDIHSAHDIISLKTDQLVLAEAAGSVTYTFDPVHEWLVRQAGSGSLQRVTSDDVAIRGSFIDSSYQYRSKSVDAVFDLIYRNQNQALTVQASTTANLTFELRGR